MCDAILSRIPDLERVTSSIIGKEVKFERPVLSGDEYIIPCKSIFRSSTGLFYDRAVREFTVLVIATTFDPTMHIHITWCGDADDHDTIVYRVRYDGAKLVLVA